jgi:hypothetical protein
MAGDALAHGVDLGLPHGAFQRVHLPVDVGLGHVVEVDQHQRADAAARQRLGGPGADAADADDRDAGLPDGRRARHAVQALEAAEAPGQVGREPRRRASPQPREPLAGGAGRLGLRIGLDQVVQRLARARVVLQLDLAVGDGQHGLGGACVVGRLLQQLAEVGQGAAVVAVGVLRVAQPEQRRGPVAALRPAADELAEGGLRAGEVALAEDAQRRLEVALLVGVGLEVAPVDR